MISSSSQDLPSEIRNLCALWSRGLGQRLDGLDESPWERAPLLNKRTSNTVLKMVNIILELLTRLPVTRFGVFKKPCSERSNLPLLLMLGVFWFSGFSAGFPGVLSGVCLGGSINC